MNEVHLGGPFPRSFVAIFQEKVKSPELVRKIALEGHRFTPQELLELRMVDQIVGGGSKGVLEGAVQLAGTTGKNASTGVWGLIKVGINVSSVLPLVVKLTAPAERALRNNVDPHWRRRPYVPSF